MRLLRYFLTIALPLFIFIFITLNVINNNTIIFDSYIYERIARYITPNLTEVEKLITFFGSGEFLVVFSLILIFSFYKIEKYSFYTAMIAINLMLSSILNEGLKYLFHRNRPEILRLISVGGFSFPSGHSMVSMSFYGLLIYLCYINFRAKFKYLIIVLLALLILSIGCSRIYLGVHFASDVAGGFSLGVTWVGIYSTIVDIRYRKKYTKIL